MAADNTPFLRLQSATETELEAFAAALGVDLKKEAECIGTEPSRETLAAILSKAFEKESDADYTSILKKVATELTRAADWKEVDLAEASHTEWLENYVFQAHVALQSPGYKDLKDDEKSTFRERAAGALEGDAPSAEEETNWWSEAAGGAVGLGWAAGWWLLPGIGIALVGWLLAGSQMKKLLPATLTLINIRKRLEFELVLKGQEAA